MSKKPGLAAVKAIAAVALGLLGSSLTCAQPHVEIEYIGGFGGYGKTEPGTFDWPVGIAIDDQGRLVIPDNDNHRVQRCTTQGACEVFGKRGSNPGEFYWPLGVAIDSLGRIIISEAGNDRIQLRNEDGSWTSFGTSQRDGPPGTFRLPAGLAVDGQDRIIIADEKNHRIQICSDTGSCSAFGSLGSAPGKFDNPRAVGLTGDGKILVADAWNDRIQVCTYQGACTAIGSFGTAPGHFFTPTGIVADNRGRLFVSEAGNHRFQVCDLSGACRAFGELGSGPGQFDQPQAIALDAMNRIYVADIGNNNIQIFQATFPDDPAPVEPVRINAGMIDAWYDPATPGQGFLITVFPERGELFLAWFTYDVARPPAGAEAQLGEPGHRWLTAQGPYADNQAVLDVWVSTGGLFDSPEPAVTPKRDGELVVEFSGCNAGTVTYELPSAGLQGVIPIERLALDKVPLCESLNAQLSGE